MSLKNATTAKLAVVMGLGLWTIACTKAPAKQGPQGPMALPVKVLTVALQNVPISDTYVATIKSRRSATIQPQVSGVITQIFVRSGNRVRQAQRLMEIDPRQQQAVVAQQRATEQQNLAMYQYNQKDIVRQKALFTAGIVSKQAFQQSEQAYNSSKATYESSVGARKSAEQQLAYYHINAPFDGIVGDVPVHIGDYVSSTTVLTTVDDNTQLEAYIYIPTERAAAVHIGLPVQITDSNGKVLDSTKIYFVSPQVDDQLQGILAKAKINTTPDVVRNEQQVRARVIWSTTPVPTVPVLAVIRVGGLPFVYLAQNDSGHFIAKQVGVTLGDAVGNAYAIKSGLQTGDKVIISGLQFLVDGAPVQPMQ